jgi:hypothetical protein
MSQSNSIIHLAVWTTGTPKARRLSSASATGYTVTVSVAAGDSLRAVGFPIAVH